MHVGQTTGIWYQLSATYLLTYLKYTLNNLHVVQSLNLHELENNMFYSVFLLDLFFDLTDANALFSCLL